MNLSFPLIAGLIASILHVITGPDHLAVVTPFAISIVDETEAKKTFEILQQLGELDELNDPEPN